MISNPLDSCLDAFADASTDMLVKQLMRTPTSAAAGTSEAARSSVVSEGSSETASSSSSGAQQKQSSPYHHHSSGWSKLKIAVLSVRKFKSSLKTR